MYEWICYFITTVCDPHLLKAIIVNKRIHFSFKDDYGMFLIDQILNHRIIVYDWPKVL